MKTGRFNIFYLILLPVFCMLFTGCSSPGDDAYSLAVEAYGNGDYAGAEPYFVTASENLSDRPDVDIGHAYNLMQLGRYSDAAEVFLTVLPRVSDESTMMTIKKRLLEAYTLNGSTKEAAGICEELSELEKDPVQSTQFRISAAEIRAGLYEAQGDKEKLKEELRKLIELKNFAAEEYIKLYSLACESDDYDERLDIAGEMIVYVSARPMLVDDYIPVINVLLDAADAAVYAGYENDREFYFTKSEEFIDLAAENGTDENLLLKLKIVLAERRGKNEVAYKLLGVYLNHCPGDAFAIKEMDYLENRIGTK